jgi:chromosome segregation ATPase
MATSSPPSTSAMTPMDSILPRTIRERHCGCEDMVRYFGGGVSFIGASYCYSYQMIIPGVLLTTAGVSIVVVHIVGKTFGTWAKAARAGERVLASYNTLIRAADQTTTKLEKIEHEGKQNEVALGVETQALLQNSEKIGHSVNETQQNIEQLKAEYTQLHASNAELQKTINSQQILMQSMQQELEQSSTQNNLYQKEAEGLTRMVSSLKHTDEKFAEQTTSATIQFQEGVDDFQRKIPELQIIAQQVQEMHAQNLLLQRRIEELQKTKEDLEKTLASIASVQTKRHENNAALSTLAAQLESNREQMATTENHMRLELAEWKRLLEKNPELKDQTS